MKLGPILLNFFLLSSVKSDNFQEQAIQILNQTVQNLKVIKDHHKKILKTEMEKLSKDFCQKKELIKNIGNQSREMVSTLEKSLSEILNKN